MDHFAEDHDSGVNIGHLATVGVVAVFPGLRRAIGILGLLGLIVAGILAIQSQHPEAVAVNPNPTCNRVTYLALEQMSDGPRDWGMKIYADRAIYYREANGTGYCMLRHDQNPVIMQDPKYGGVWKYRVYEVPSKFSQNVENIAPKENGKILLALVIGLVSLGLLSIWFLASIAAAVGRKLLRDVREEPL